MTIKHYKLIPKKDLPIIAANPVKEITKEIKDLAINLGLTMRKHQGIGIAAPQVGLHLCILVLDTCTFTTDNSHGCTIMINPEILEAKGEQELIEGCLSFPGEQVKVKRYKTVRVKWKTTQNEFVETTFHGLAAQVIQHEYDHLLGKTMYDEDGWKL